MKKRVEAEMAVAALSGDNATVVQMIEHGLRSFEGARRKLDTMTSAVLASASARRRYVAAGLPYGAKLVLPLGDTESRQRMRSDGTTFSNSTRSALIKLTRRSGRAEQAFDVHQAALWLADRVKGNPDAAVRVLMAIERARRQMFALAEEGTRWQ